jgi:hypothetical protein
VPDPLASSADPVALCPDTTRIARVVVVGFELPAAATGPASVRVPTPPGRKVATAVVVDGTSPLGAARAAVVAGAAVVVVTIVVVVAAPRGGALPYARGTVTYQVS